MIEDRLIIKDILIAQYRSCLDTRFHLHPGLSVLIGPNSSGKTNIMNALFLLKRLTEETTPFYSRDLEPTGHCKLKATLSIGDIDATLSSDIDTYTDADNTDIVLTSDQYWTIPRLTGNRKKARLPLALAREFIRPPDSPFLSYYQRRISLDALEQVKKQTSPPVRDFLGQVAQKLAQMRYYSASQFTNPGNCPVSFELERDEKTTRPGRLTGHAKFLFGLYNCRKHSKSRYSQFMNIIGPDGIGLVDDIYFKEVSTSSVQHSVRIGGTVTERRKRNIIVIPQFKIGKNVLSPNQLSEGTFKTITLLFYLITEPSQILLIEEPEVCVHHGLLSSIIELIKTYADLKQIVISTHSDFVLDMVQPENVYAVTNIAPEGTKVHHIPTRLSANELNALRNYLQTEGNLGEYWRAGGLE